MVTNPFGRAQLTQIAASVSLLLSQPAISQSETPSESIATEEQDKHATADGWYGGSAASELLPENVIRNRFIFSSGSGSSGFDSSGKKIDTGIQASKTGGAYVFEYGLTDRITLQLINPIVAKSAAGLNADQFRQSALYKSNYDKFVSAMATYLLNAGSVCATQASCEEKILAGYRLPTDTTVTLPSGETLTAKADARAIDVIDATVITAAAPQSGATGIGDIQIGAGYAVLKEGLVRLSVAGGWRLPTGSFEKVPSAQRPTGSGMHTIAFRTIADMIPTKGVAFSWDNTVEKTVTKARRKKSSLLDPNTLNAADPTSATARAAGSNGQDNNQEIERTGIRNVGYVAAKAALGHVTPALWFSGIQLGMDYDFGGAIKTDGTETEKPYAIESAFGALEFGTFFAGPIPYRFEIKHSSPVAGKNVLVAAKQTTVQVHAFLKF